ncbi:pilus assembly FimT family protein [Noviherbaspirillum sp.]|uniref:pilus assembly FimT family protein n=1 Tax=Noviherbaspirillum sp. TaxID=1926288 RepID=UPI002FDFE51A
MKRHARYAHGFTITEMALTIAVIGLMAATGAAAYARLADRANQQISVQASATALNEAVIAFAAGRFRLPCPSMDNSGHEGTGGICAATDRVGMFPYSAVGLPMPAPGARALYGVYRHAAADLAAAREYTGDPAGSPAHAARSDFLHALRTAAAQGLSDSQPYTTGDGAANGAEDCSSVRSNPAFVVTLPGADRDGDGRGFDGIHQSLPGTGRCFSAPTRAADSGFDDTTEAFGFYALLARLHH